MHDRGRESLGLLRLFKRPTAPEPAKLPRSNAFRQALARRRPLYPARASAKRAATSSQLTTFHRCLT
ncbi:hypothetical protein A8926_3261 [Saccharopolyspora spinosa]|uniref:Uncharacterized protein n=1 Tax=Saccharopolyspora spinosa TaxID=60894 RepID=A0A2N3XXY7_SACSN|nr:hypothetical protein A8926_3261 [Saccharopolyspora spinosa]